ncbi:hypothetical protein F66182_3788 [Fusarium sp. NRRL 66182]|nr:hypothetical protein F66182_3788 [Fusarium sp. NRRL 66182]
MAANLKHVLTTLAKEGDVNQMRHLLSTGQQSPSEETIQNLLTAANKSSQLEMVTFLLTQYPSVPLNEEIVRSAVNTGSIPIMSALLARDASLINMQFDMRGTPLIVACMGRQKVEYLEFMLEAGADPNQDPDAAAFPLALVAGLYTDPTAIDLLLQHGARLESSGALAAAARRDNEPMMRSLLDRGACSDTDAPAIGTGASPLHIAVKAGHVGVARILVQRGADPHVVDASGVTAVEVAEQMKGQGKDVSEMMEVVGGK